MNSRCMGTVLPVVFFISFVLNISAVAKQAEFKDRFPGRWKADKEKTKNYASEHKDAKAFPEDYLESMPSMTVEFLESGKLTGTVKELPNDESASLQGEWEIIEATDESHADVKITMKVDRGEDPKFGKAEFLDDDTLVISIEDEPTIVLVRSKEKSNDDADDSSGEKDKSRDDGTTTGEITEKL